MQQQMFEGTYEECMLRLEAELPAGVRLVACVTCLYSDYSPARHGLMGMSCHRDAKSQYLAVSSKADDRKVPVARGGARDVLVPGVRAPRAGHRLPRLRRRRRQTG